MAPLAELPVGKAYELWAPSYPPLAHNALMRAEERAMLKWMPASLEVKSVVDIGCGSGRYLLHAQRRGASLLGVDLSGAMLERAARLGLPVARADLRRLPVSSNSADVVLCALTLGHVKSLQTALSEIARVLRPRGGMALCSELHPAGFALGWQRTFSVGEHRYAVEHATHHYADWHQGCRSAGLAIQDVIEPRLDPADIAPCAQIDPRALEIPVVLALKLRR